jgi:radical SAM superfamily enzyme YgiQ (UPF0313 family)
LKILLVYPQYPDTFWSFKHALRLSRKKALNTPLGPLTVAALLPTEWEKRFVDLNVGKLKDKDIRRADYVFISAMVVQQKSTMEVVQRCKKLNTKVVAGGPLFTTGYTLVNCDEIDHVIRNEAEITLPLFLEDLKNGCPKHFYQTDERADVTKTPVPLYSLAEIDKYSQVTIQYCRGCPYDCEFCDIIIMDGRKPRTKTKEQMLAELEAIYGLGYRGTVFIVDDNFIGNRKKLKLEILPAMIEWQKKNRYPFKFLTEASIDMADDNELCQMMSDAGFTRVFVGIETPNEESLAECNKFKNQNRDLVADVKKLQNYGFEVMGGFILGFDSDPISIFKHQISFIQKSGIVTAMVGILNAPPETKLWLRLEKENRILPSGSGDNTDGTSNMIPKMRLDVLINGYKQVLHEIYSPKQYYERIHTFLKEYKPNEKIRRGFKLQLSKLQAIFEVTIFLGIKDRARVHYWKMIFSTLRKYPKFIGIALTLAAQGFHFRKVYEKVKQIKVDDSLLKRQLKILNGKPA